MDKLISQQAAIDVIFNEPLYESGMKRRYADVVIPAIYEKIKSLPSAQPESTRTFVELVVKYPDPELCTYKEYKGKPYYSIKYIENGETYIGYGTYNPKVLSQYLKEYFLLSAQPERKTGSWIPVTNGRGGHKCDKCGSYAPSYKSGAEWLSNFCPECNADMREGGQDG